MYKIRFYRALHLLVHCINVVVIEVLLLWCNAIKLGYFNVFHLNLTSHCVKSASKNTVLF